MITIFLNIFVAILNDSYEDSKLEEDDDDEDEDAPSDFAEKYLPSWTSFAYPLVLYFYIDFFENFYIRSIDPSNADEVNRWFEKYVIAKKGITYDDENNEDSTNTNGQGSSTISNSSDGQSSEGETSDQTTPLNEQNDGNAPKGKNRYFNWFETFISDHMNEFLHEKDLVSHLFFSEKHMYKIFDVDSIVSLLDEIRQSNSEFADKVNEIDIQKSIFTYSFGFY